MERIDDILEGMGYSKPMYYNIDGEPIDMMQWSQLLELNEYKIVKVTYFGDDIRVSTVWLGLDHGFRQGPPLIFETMIFGGEYDEYQDRYSTVERAQAGHEAACKLVVSAMKGGEAE